MKPEDWSEAWGICQMVPGVNVIAVSALTGHRLAGWPGAGGSVAGLIVPSVVITLLMTAGFVHIRDLLWVRSGLHGLVFAAAGGSMMVAYRLIWPLLGASRQESRPRLAAAVGIVGGAALLAATGRIPLLAVLLGAGAILAGVFSATRSPSEAVETP